MRPMSVSGEAKRAAVQYVLWIAWAAIMLRILL